MIQLDHLAVEARDVAASARFLADLLGLAQPVPEGEDDDMRRIDLDHGVFVLFSPASEPRFSHVAFRVDAARFGAIVDRLRARGVAFGNDHDDTRNHRTDDLLGGEGRVYFHDADGHLWEVAC